MSGKKILMLVGEFSEEYEIFVFEQAMRPYVETPWRVPASDSDADVRAFIRRYTHSIFHGSGTCAMGTVVDAELRVLGIDALRVVDVSVMPAVGRGAPNASAIVIGEKAADLILGRDPLPAERVGAPAEPADALAGATS